MLFLAGNIGLDPKPLIRITHHHRPKASADLWEARTHQRKQFITDEGF